MLHSKPNRSAPEVFLAASLVSSAEQREKVCMQPATRYPSPATRNPLPATRGKVLPRFGPPRAI